MTATKPSAGALRAAETYIKGRGDTPPQNIEAAISVLAQIIDGKSGLAELLEAAQRVAKWIDAGCDPSTKSLEALATGHR